MTRQRYVVAALATLAGFAVPLTMLPSRWLRSDWAYFDTMSALARTAVLREHAIPWHNPYSCGGVDLLANPQSHIFSPHILFDIALPSEAANMAWFIALSIGGWLGAYALLRERNVGSLGSAAVATVYANQQFFALHFAEGHLPYASMQLLPWVPWCVWRLDLPERVLGLLGVLVFSALDGAIYADIYATMLFFALLATGATEKRLKDVVAALRAALRAKPVVFTLALVGSACLLTAKGLPLLATFAGRAPQLDAESTPLVYALLRLVDPFATAQEWPPWARYRAHEYGLYLGVPALGVLLFASTRRGFLRENAVALLLAAFWLWCALGWGYPVNPWFVFERLPIVNNAHVNARVALLAFLLLLVPLGRALDLLPRRVLVGAAVVLALEAIMVHNHPFRSSYEQDSLPALRTPGWMSSAHYKGTQQGGDTRATALEARATRFCYEPAGRPTAVRAREDDDYRGEAYFTEGEGGASVVRYGPGRLVVEMTPETPNQDFVVTVNTSYLSGWRVRGDEATAYATPEGLLAIRSRSGPSAARQIVELVFAPRFGTALVLLALLGWALWGIVVVRVRGS